MTRTGAGGTACPRAPARPAAIDSPSLTHATQTYNGPRDRRAASERQPAEAASNGDDRPARDRRHSNGRPTTTEALTVMKELHNNIKAGRGISPAAAITNADTAFVSQINDTANFGASTFIGLFGAITDANVTFAVTVHEGDAANLSDASVVAVGDLLGVTGMGLQFDSDDKTFKISYKGSKRYWRVTITPTGNDAGSIFLAGIFVQGLPRVLPQSTQVV
jgi:hypothetical protein